MSGDGPGGGGPRRGVLLTAALLAAAALGVYVTFILLQVML